MIKLESQIESILFVKTEGVKIAYLAKLLEVSNADIESSAENLRQELAGRGVQLLSSGETLMLVSHADMSPKLATLFEEEISGELSPASLQTLSIILYRKVCTRGEISYIRGVDSRMSLRNLSLRGLVEKVQSDSYRATTDCLRHLGVTRVEDLPRFKDIYDSLVQEVTKKNGA
jgi:segregation and condensation protein B